MVQYDKIQIWHYNGQPWFIESWTESSYTISVGQSEKSFQHFHPLTRKILASINHKKKRENGHNDESPDPYLQSNTRIELQLLVRSNEDGWVVTTKAEGVRERHLHIQPFLFRSHQNIYILTRHNIKSNERSPPSAYNEMGARINKLVSNIKPNLKQGWWGKYHENLCILFYSRQLSCFSLLIINYKRK